MKPLVLVLIETTVIYVENRALQFLYRDVAMVQNLENNAIAKQFLPEAYHQSTPK